jgi:hypothetical protein
MTATECPAATRTTPLPVRLDEAPDRFVLFVGDRKAASAWGPAVDDPDTWFYWPGHCDPYRIGGGREGARELMEGRRDEWLRREGSLWHPDHGEPDEYGHLPVAPAGVVCEGCGQDVSGDRLASVVGFRRDGEITYHYVCPTCECYLDDED